MGANGVSGGTHDFSDWTVLATGEKLPQAFFGGLVGEVALLGVRLAR